MGLRLGLDFGTATTCVAIVPADGSFQPDVIPIVDRRAFVESLAWVTQPGLLPPIVKSTNLLGRCPVQLFEPAGIAFWDYWRSRVRTQQDGVKWSQWRRDGREQSMLLSYFKPELADDPTSRTEEFPSSVESFFDPMTQSEDVNIYYSTRVIADPAPDTSDLVAASAAIIRHAVQAARDRYNAKIDLLVIGVPSLAEASNRGEIERSSARRREAVELSRVRQDFGSSEFRVELFGEAEAAGYGVDVEGDAKEVFSIIIDVGAGTTDMALVPYRRESGKRALALPPLARDSMRFAGRNLNEAIALGLRNFPKVKRAYQAMDQRSWQILMEHDVERIKRALSHDEATYRIGFNKYAAVVDTGLWDDRDRQALKATEIAELSLDTPQIRSEVQRACRLWKDRATGFLKGAKAMLGSRDLVTVELVGGAFRFAPLRQASEAAVRVAGLDSSLVKYRDQGDASQTVVARGLARRAALAD